MFTPRNRHAKILATIGPASNTPEMLRKLFDAGVDAFRLNFSHGAHELHAQVIAHIRAMEKEVGRPIAILQDLQGPKIRIGEMAVPIDLKTGDSFILDNNTAPGDATRVHLPHPEIMGVLKAGDKVYINDGTVRLTVAEKTANGVRCTVTAGGIVSSRKGVNLPGVDLPISSITEKDWKDLDFGLSQGVDWVAVSFVQKPDDVIAVQEKVAGRALVISKIEMPNAVDRIDSILAVSDAIMVARGDLGVEVPLEEVPCIQKRLIRKCREAGKPVVVATQMLESMINSAMPTRAEVSDVANATFEGADALMLSAESAAGKYPVEAVTTMDKVICRVEKSSAWMPMMNVVKQVELDEAEEAAAAGKAAVMSVSDALTTAAFHTAQALNAETIVTFTESGSTALRMSRRRPHQRILMLTPNEKVARRLVLGWGLHGVVTATQPNGQSELVAQAAAAAKAAGLAKQGDVLVVTAGVPFGQEGTTNLVRVATVD